MNIHKLGPIGVKENRTVTIPWGDSAQAPDDPFLEAEVRTHIRDSVKIMDSHKTQDNNTRTYDWWGVDLDPKQGRVLRQTTKSADAKGLKGESVQLAVSARFDPETKLSKSLDITSANRNLSMHITWHNGEFQSEREERVLSDGSKEVVEMVVDRENGTLTYTTRLIPKEG